MGEIWVQMGVIRWPITFAAVMVVTLTAWSLGRLYGANAEGDARTKAMIDAVLFWGGFASVSGVLGTLVGFVLVAQAVERLGELSTSLLWGGIKVAMLSSAVGVTILAGSALLWFFLQLRWRLLRASD